MKEDIYYVGFNANNAICNEDFFKGSITLYPTNEKGNFNFFDYKKQQKCNLDYEYKDFVEKTISDILETNPNAKIICFNSKAKELCKKFNSNFTLSNDDILLAFLNDKYKTRELVKDVVPILNYVWLNNLDLSYSKICNIINSNTFVVQAVCGAGGNNTYNVLCENDYCSITNRIGKFCVSSYVKNTPLNVTAIIANDKNIILPPSAQLILSNNSNFLYAGGDFAFVSTLGKSIINKIYDYTNKILNIVKDKGYRGIIGIDYILDKNNKVYFMEINPRFQASSFLINLELEERGFPCLAELNYNALNGLSLPDIKLSINKSFLNCNEQNSFDEFNADKLVFNGYFKFNKSSIYRKVFNASIINNNLFEHI